MCVAGPHTFCSMSDSALPTLAYLILFVETYALPNYRVRLMSSIIDADRTAAGGVLRSCEPSCCVEAALIRKFSEMWVIDDIIRIWWRRGRLRGNRREWRVIFWKVRLGWSGNLGWDTKMTYLKNYHVKYASTITMVEMANMVYDLVDGNSWISAEVFPNHLTPNPKTFTNVLKMLDDLWRLEH